MPFREPNSETDPDTILAIYNQPDDEVLQAEIALLTGTTQRDAINAALATTSTTGSGSTGASAAGNANIVRPRFKADPNDVGI